MERRKGFGFALFLFLSVFTVYGLVRMAYEWYSNTDIELVFAKSYTGENKTTLPYQHAIVRQAVRPSENGMAVLKPASPKKIFKQVSILGTEQKGKSSGALQNLFLTIHNGSLYLIEQVQVEVEFVDKQGKSMGSKIIPIDKLKPSGNTLIQVPYCKHGLNVKYRIMNIYLPSKNPAQKLA